MAAVLSPGEIEAYLHRHIPISAAMGVRVLACGAAGATLAAPLAPNLNHRGTVFGGSASAVAMLAAWTWLHFTLRTAGKRSRLVIQKNTMEYLAPIAGDFEAHSTAPSAHALESFLLTLGRHDKARITLGVLLTCAAAEVARFSGDYVAVKPG